MSMAREPLRKVCVAGGGQVGVLAAIGIKRALPSTEVMVIGLQPGSLDFADHASTSLSFSNKLHDRLGITEQAIIARAGGSHRLMTRYIGWGGEGQHGALSYGGGDAALAGAFAREWGGGSRNAAGDQLAGSLAQVLAEAGKFRTPPPDEVTPLAEIDYCLRWNPKAYLGLLIAEAQRRGVTHVEGEIAGVEPDGNGGIASLTISAQRSLQADLFVDCSGSRACLLSALPEFRAQNWQGVVGERRLLFAEPGQGMLALEDRISLLPEGWLLEFAGRDGLQIVLGSAHDVADEALDRALNSRFLADVRLTAGNARSCWLGNVVALGDAAAQFEPLGFLNLDLAHRMLALLLELLPGRTIEPLERAEFNRRAAQMIKGVRDSLATHYASSDAQRVFGTQVPPEGVAIALDQFARRGRLPFQEDFPLSGAERMSLLRALGFAEGIPPQERGADPRRAQSARQAFEIKARAALEYAPPYDEWMTVQLQQPMQARR